MFEALFSKVESIAGAFLFSNWLTIIRLGFLKIAFSEGMEGGGGGVGSKKSKVKKCDIICYMMTSLVSLH